jgi:acyl carrier protein
VSGAGDLPVIDQLRQILAEVSGRAELLDIPAPTPLLGPGVGLGSLAGTLLLRRVRDRFGVDIAAEDLNLDALATLATLTAYIEERAGSAQPACGAARPGRGRAAAG